MVLKNLYALFIVLNTAWTSENWTGVVSHSMMDLDCNTEETSEKGAQIYAFITPWMGEAYNLY